MGDNLINMVIWAIENVETLLLVMVPTNLKYIKLFYKCFKIYN